MFGNQLRVRREAESSCGYLGNNVMFFASPPVRNRIQILVRWWRVYDGRAIHKLWLSAHPSSVLT